MTKLRDLLTEAGMTNFKVGDFVVFGHPNGAQTHGIVRKVEGKTLKIEQTEARVVRFATGPLRQAGTKWRVATSLVRHAAKPSDVAAAE